MSIEAPQVGTMPQGGADSIDIDWGDNTAGIETGALKAGDTVASCVVALAESPSGSTTPTLGSVTVNVTALFVNGRSCAAGQATSCTVTMGAAQTVGRYVLKFTATTTNSFVLPRFVTVIVRLPK